MVRDFYGFAPSPFLSTSDPACYFDAARIDQIARRLLMLAADHPQDHPGDTSIAPAQDYTQDHAALLERLNSLESRVIEQERTIRHTMTILIEWIERDDAPVLAA